MIQIEIDTHPISWAAAKVTRRGSYNPKAKEKEATQWLIRSKYRGSPVLGYVVVEFVFYFSPPSSVPLSKRQAYLENIEYLPTKCDCTNLQKFLEDCMKNLVIEDDRNVAKISSEKLYAEKEKVIIKIWIREEYRNEVARRSTGV